MRRVAWPGSGCGAVCVSSRSTSAGSGLRDDNLKGSRSAVVDATAQLSATKVAEAFIRAADEDYRGEVQNQPLAGVPDLRVGGAGRTGPWGPDAPAAPAARARECARRGGAATVELGATSARLHGRGAVWHGDAHGREHVLYVVVALAVACA